MPLPTLCPLLLCRDRLNEAARIESVAKNGAILGSRRRVERLVPDAARELDLGRDRLSYCPLSEPGAVDKAVRDAGSIAVAELRRDSGTPRKTPDTSSPQDPSQPG